MLIHGREHNEDSFHSLRFRVSFWHFCSQDMDSQEQGIRAKCAHSCNHYQTCTYIETLANVVLRDPFLYSNTQQLRFYHGSHSRRLPCSWILYLAILWLLSIVAWEALPSFRAPCTARKTLNDLTSIINDWHFNILDSERSYGIFAPGSYTVKNMSCAMCTYKLPFGRCCLEWNIISLELLSNSIYHGCHSGGPPLFLNF